MPEEKMEVKKDDVVVDIGKSQWSDLWKKEDYWAIWLAVLILGVGLFLFLSHPPVQMHENMIKYNQVLETESGKAPFKTIAWHQASLNKRKIKATSEPYAETIRKFLELPGEWHVNPLESIFQTGPEAEAKNEQAAETYNNAKVDAAQALEKAHLSENKAGSANFQNTELNSLAEQEIQEWLRLSEKSSKLKKKTENAAYNKAPYLFALAIMMALVFSIGLKVMGKPVLRFFAGFSVVFIFAVLAFILESQQTMKIYGFGYALWAIFMGMLISNTSGTPEWVKPGVLTEYYIKTGLVLLGAEILFGKIMAIGIPGIFVAWVVTPIVLITTFWFGQKILKMPSKTLNMTISADMCVCGVSAAIATASACRAKKEELTLAVGLSMVFTAVMMVAMPAFIKAVGIPEILGGAWIGGTIDSTGAVAAAGAFLGDKAMYVAATIKMIQNVLIGLVAFCVALYWCAKVDCAPGQKVSWMEIWYRFPKFVIGFIGMSIIFSIIDLGLGKDVSYVLIDNGVLRGFARHLREWFFCLAFVSIGLSTNFRELKQYFKGGKPLILYVCGQTLNLILTLLMAYIMFYLVFPEITAKI